MCVGVSVSVSAVVFMVVTMVAVTAVTELDLHAPCYNCEMRRLQSHGPHSYRIQHRSRDESDSTKHGFNAGPTSVSISSAVTKNIVPAGKETQPAMTRNAFMHRSGDSTNNISLHSTEKYPWKLNGSAVEDPHNSKKKWDRSPKITKAIRRDSYMYAKSILDPYMQGDQSYNAPTTYFNQNEKRSELGRSSQHAHRHKLYSTDNVPDMKQRKINTRKLHKQNGYNSGEGSYHEIKNKDISDAGHASSSYKKVRLLKETKYGGISGYFDKLTFGQQSDWQAEQPFGEPPFGKVSLI